MEDIEFYLQVSVTVILAVCGWVIAHWFTSRRDRKNTERKARLDALSMAYFAFVRAGIEGTLVKRDHDGNLLPTARDVENAIATMHLYGTIEQSSLANSYVKNLQQNQAADGTQIVDNLREDLRAALGLPKLSDKPQYARIEIFKNSSNHSTQADGNGRAARP